MPLGGGAHQDLYKWLEHKKVGEQPPPKPPLFPIYPPLHSQCWPCSPAIMYPLGYEYKRMPLAPTKPPRRCPFSTHQGGKEKVQWIPGRDLLSQPPTSPAAPHNMVRVMNSVSLPKIFNQRDTATVRIVAEALTGSGGRRASPSTPSYQGKGGWVDGRKEAGGTRGSRRDKGKLGYIRGSNSSSNSPSPHSLSGRRGS